MCNHEKCDEVLSTEMDKKSRKEVPSFKQRCGHNYTPQEQECYILMLPVEKQIEFFINHYDLPDDLEEQDPNYRGDVNTGGVYRKLRDEGLVTKNTITVQLNLDGAACFKVIISQLISSKHFNYATKLNCIFFYLLGQLIFILAFNGPYK